MRATYQQVAEKYGDEDESPSDDRSPTRESNERSWRNTRTMSASRRSTMNSMSQTIDPRHAANHQQHTANISPARTLGSASRHRAPANASLDDGTSNFESNLSFFNLLGAATLRDNPRRDAFGPLAKDLKINTLRT